MSGGITQVGLVLQAHQLSAAHLVQQLVVVLDAVDPLLKVVLEGLGDGDAGSGVLGGLLSLGSSLGQLGVLGLGGSGLLGLGSGLGQLSLGVLSVLILGGLVVLLQGVRVVVVVVVALRGPSAIGAVDNGVHALTEDAGQSGIAADVLVADQVLAGDDDLAGGHGDVNIVELVALDDAGAVGRGLLHVDDSGVQLGHGHGHDLLAGVEGVLHLNALEVVHLVQSLALLLADAPVLHQTGTLHQAHGQEGQAQGSGVQLKHQNVLRVVLVGQLALLDGGAEAAGHVGVAGVGGVAVDVSLHALLTDQHIPVAAGRTGPDGEVLLALSQDLSHRGIGLTVGGEAAEGDAVSALDEFRNRVVQGVNFVHSENPHYTYFLMYGFSFLRFHFVWVYADSSVASLAQDLQKVFGELGEKFAYLRFPCYNAIITHQPNTGKSFQTSFA